MELELAVKLLTAALGAVKAALELLNLREKEAHPARRSPPKHLKKKGRWS